LANAGQGQEDKSFMLILDRPYVSRLLEETAVRHRIPVLPAAGVELALGEQMERMQETDFFARWRRAERPLILTNSENALAAIERNLPDSWLWRAAVLLKDKGEFRRRTRPLYPHFHFRRLRLEELSRVDAAELSFPAVLKPAVGFFSMGVHRVADAAAWSRLVRELPAELAKLCGLYPACVIGLEDFLLEEYLEEEELAVDAYFDGEGRPVVLNVFQHLFAGPEDTSDRVYFTGREVIEAWRAPLERELERIGEVCGLRDFPVHAEFRRTCRGLVPVEINPLRFAGWGTCDLAWFAWGINPYEAFLFDRRPDWGTILAGCGAERFFFNIAALPPTIDRWRIRAVRYEALQSLFANVLDCRPTDFRRYPVLAVLFTRSSDFAEAERFLGEDFTRYLIT
jgi:hypothetical protein